MLEEILKGDVVEVRAGVIVENAVVEPTPFDAVTAT